MRFAQTQASINRAVITHLADSQVVILGASVSAVFDEAHAVADLQNPGMATTMPALTVRSQDLPSGALVGQVINVSAKPYRVYDAQEEAGLKTLLLEHAA
ncbi:MAG: head-tail joining protein [Burkholderiaceae bacterium]